MALIPDKNPKALIGYYLGFVSLLPCIGFPFSVAAIILGIMGLQFSRQHPEAEGGGHAIVGIVLGVFSLLANAGCGGLMLIGMLANP